jgi:hypothetical protein
MVTPIIRTLTSHNQTHKKNSLSLCVRLPTSNIWKIIMGNLLDNFPEIDAIINYIIFWWVCWSHFTFSDKDSTFLGPLLKKTRELGVTRFINKAYCILYKRLLGTSGAIQVYRNFNFMFQWGQGSSGTSLICPHDLSLSIIHYSKPLISTSSQLLRILHLLCRQLKWYRESIYTLNVLSPMILDGRPRLMRKLKVLLVNT